MKTPDYSELLQFIDEREQVRWNKEVEGFEAPWTEDPVLQQYKFCNVRRADDRVSRWLMHRYYSRIQASVSAEKDYWFAAAVARLINWPPTLQQLLDAGAVPANAESFNAQHFIKCLDAAKPVGGKLYNGAYMIYPGHEAGRKKSQFIAEIILQELKERHLRIRWAVSTRSVQKVVWEAANVYGLSTFMGGQIAADLTYIKGQLDTATDLRTYAPRGPGSQGGLNVLFGLKPNHEWKDDEFSSALVLILREVENTPTLKVLNLTLHDVQNCMCEWFRYVRLKAGKVASQRKYKTETEF